MCSVLGESVEEVLRSARDQTENDWSQLGLISRDSIARSAWGRVRQW